MAIHITDHEAQGLAWLPAQLQDSSSARALTSVVLEQVQRLEDALWDLLTRRGLGTAEGRQLDQLGVLVGERRNGLNDADYRLRIRLRIHRNMSRGEPERLIRVLQELTGSTLVELQETSPGVVHLTFDGNALPPDLHLAMEGVAAVGVRLELIQAPANAFVFSCVATPTLPSNGGGFSDQTQSAGGGLSQEV